MTNKISEIWTSLQDPSTQGAVTVVIAVIVALLSGMWALYKHFTSRDTPPAQQASGVGGKGGNASVGGNGIALGGRGGRAGEHGCGNGGGGGGNARVDGDGVAVGGDGGDGGLPWRPVLGGASPMERTGALFGVSDGLVDRYGFFTPGRGGVGGNPDCEIQFDGHAYKLIPLLNLLRLWSPETIDRVDATKPSSPQEFWDRAQSIAPEVCRRALDHVRACEKGERKLDPYVIAKEYRNQG